MAATPACKNTMKPHMQGVSGAQYGCLPENYVIYLSNITKPRSQHRRCGTERATAFVLVLAEQRHLGWECYARINQRRAHLLTVLHPNHHLLPHLAGHLHAVPPAEGEECIRGEHRALHLSNSLLKSNLCALHPAASSSSSSSETQRCVRFPQTSTPRMAKCLLGLVAAHHVKMICAALHCTPPAPISPVGLPAAHAQQLAVLGHCDGVGLDVLHTAPGKLEVLKLLSCGLHLTSNSEGDVFRAQVVSTL